MSGRELEQCCRGRKYVVEWGWKRGGLLWRDSYIVELEVEFWLDRYLPCLLNIALWLMTTVYKTLDAFIPPLASPKP